MVRTLHCRSTDNTTTRCTLTLQNLLPSTYYLSDKQQFGSSPSSQGPNITMTLSLQFFVVFFLNALSILEQPAELDFHLSTSLFISVPVISRRATILRSFPFFFFFCCFCCPVCTVNAAPPRTGWGWGGFSEGRLVILNRLPVAHKGQNLARGWGRRSEGRE